MISNTRNSNRVLNFLRSRNKVRTNNKFYTNEVKYNMALSGGPYLHCVTCNYFIKKEKRLMFFKDIPVPLTTARNGSSATCTGNCIF